MKGNWRILLVIILMLMSVIFATVMAEEERSLILPSDLQIIEREAFLGATSIDTVVVPEGVLEIRERAFAESSVRRIMFPESLMLIADDAFEGCDGLEATVVEGSYAAEWWRVYQQKQSETDASLFEYAITNESCTITGYTGEDSVVIIPEKIEDTVVTTIGGSAFSDNTIVSKVVIQEGVTELKAYAFSGCSNLESVELPRSLDKIGSSAFRDSILLKEIVIPEGVKSISDSCFRDCTALERVVLPQSLSSISTSAFRGCGSLVDIELPDALTYIGSYAFNQCSSLVEITIPDGLANIGGTIFNQCYALDYIYCTLGSVGAAELSDCGIEFTDRRYPEYAVLQYAGEDGTITLGIEAYLGPGGEVIVPGEMGGYGVSQIGGAFINREDLVSVVIPEGVTQICNQAFQGCTGLVSVSLPEGLSAIPFAAFCNCSNLTEVNIPSTVTVVDYQAFLNCSSLKQIRVPEGVLEIGANAFGGCSGLEQVFLPEGLTSIGNSAFEGCSVLSEAALPSALEKIGNRAFYNCSVLSGVDLPAGLTSIGSYAFGYCKELTHANIPGGVVAVNDHAFIGCTAMEELTLGEGIEAIGESAFMYCSGIDALTIPDSVSSIGKQAFYNWSSLKKLVLPDSVVELGEFAFYGCAALEEIELSHGLTVISKNGFSNCKNLTEVEIPMGVTELASQAFSGCLNLTGVTIPPTVVAIADDTFRTTGGNLIIYGEIGSYAESYAVNQGYTFVEIGGELPPPNPFTYIINADGVVITGWSGEEAELTIPASIADLPVVAIGESAFENMTVLKAVMLPDSLTSIGAKAFSGCVNMNSVVLNEGLLEIGQRAFAETAIEEVSLSSSLTYIADDAFSGCNDIVVTAQEGTYAYEWCVANGYIEEKTGDFEYSIENGAAVLTGYTGTETEVVIPETLGGYPVKIIGADAFLNCESVTEIIIPDGVISIGNYAFCGTGLTDISIPDSVVSLGGFAFCRCYSLQSVELSSNLEVLGEYAFSWCRALKEITLPDSLISFGDYAFMGCSALKKIGFPAEIVSIGDGAFCYCSALEAVSYPSGLSEIPFMLFSYCGALAELEFQGTVTAIGEKAFIGCTSLTEIILPTGLESIGSEAFAGCSELIRVEIPASTVSIEANAFDNCHEHLAIYGADGSFAQEYAQSQNRPFNRPYGSYDNGIFVYTVSDEIATIVGYLSTEAQVIIPHVIDDYIVRAIGDDAFRDCDWITGVEIPSTITSIGTYAFSNCERLAEVLIHDATVAVGDYAFSSCPVLENVTVLEGMMSVGAGAFSDCVMLASIDVPASVTSIGDGALLGCSEQLIVYTEFDTCAVEYAHQNQLAFSAKDEIGLRYTVRNRKASVTGYTGSAALLDIPDWVKGCDVIAISDGALFRNTSVEKVILNKGVEEIGGSAFSGCTSLAEVELPDGLKRLGDFAFFGCAALETIEVPGSIEEWGTHTFAECSGLKEIALKRGLTQLGTAAFYGCTRLKEISLPLGIETIGNAALRGCTQIERLIIPVGTQSIGSYACADCSALKWVFIPGSVSAIGEKAFANCHDDLRIYGPLVSYAHTHAVENNLLFVAAEYDAEADILTYDMSILHELATGYMPGPLLVLNNEVAENMSGVDFYTYFKDHPIRSIFVGGEELLIPGPREELGEAYETYYKEAAMVTLYYLCNGHLTETEQTLSMLKGWKKVADVSAMAMSIYEAVTLNTSDSLSVGELLDDGDYGALSDLQRDMLDSQFMSLDVSGMQKYITPGVDVKDQDLYKALINSSGEILDALILNAYRSVVLESLKDDIKDLMLNGVNDYYAGIFAEILADIDAEQDLLCNCAFEVTEEVIDGMNMPHVKTVVSAFEGTGTGEWTLMNVVDAGGELTVNFLTDFWLGAKAVKLGFDVGTNIAEVLIGTEEIGLQMRNYAMGYVTLYNALQRLEKEIDELPDFATEQELKQLFATYDLFIRVANSTIAIGETLVETIHDSAFSNIMNGGTETLELWRTTLTDAANGIENHYTRVYGWYEDNCPSALK